MKPTLNEYLDALNVLARVPEAVKTVMTYCEIRKTECPTLGEVIENELPFKLPPTAETMFRNTLRTLAGYRTDYTGVLYRDVPICDIPTIEYKMVRNVGAMLASIFDKLKTFYTKNE